MLLWAVSFVAIIASFAVAPSQSSLVATVCFLYLPFYFMNKRNEDYRDYGFTLSRWGADLAHVALLCVLVGPLFFWGFTVLVSSLAHIPPAFTRFVTPLTGHRTFSPRLPPAFAQQVVTQLFVVALPEEFFFRGYLLTRLKESFPGGPRVLGVTMGKAFFLTALLFALVHLAVFQAWRLWVFFPALLFGWLKERTGTLLGCTLFHASCNLYELWLEVSFQG